MLFAQSIPFCANRHFVGLPIKKILFRPIACDLKGAVNCLIRLQ